MASKAAKLKQKRVGRGRPKMENVAREPNGRVSRSGIDHGPADIIALSARAKHTGLDIAKAKDQKAGTFLGYLNILGKTDGISDDQYEAAQKFLELRSSYLRSIKAPDPSRDNDTPGGAGDHISEAYEDWCADVAETWKDCRKAIQSAQNESRQNLWAAVDLCMINDGHFHHMIGAIRLVCNALIRFFRV